MFILGDPGHDGLRGIKGQYSSVNLTKVPEAVKLACYILSAVFCVPQVKQEHQVCQVSLERKDPKGRWVSLNDA